MIMAGALAPRIAILRRCQFIGNAATPKPNVLVSGVEFST